MKRRSADGHSAIGNNTLILLLIKCASRQCSRIMSDKWAFASTQLVLVLPLGKVTEIMTATAIRTALR